MERKQLFSLIDDGRPGRFSVGESQVVRVFHFEGQSYAYFVRSGDVAKLSSVTADGLWLIANDVPMERIQQELLRQHGSVKAEQAVSDLCDLLDAGYMAPEVAVSALASEEMINGLLKLHPRNLMLFVTEACNLRCSYCYEVANGVHHLPDTLKLRNAEEVIRYYVDSTGERESVAITFFGGEPLLNFKLLKSAVEFARQLCDSVGKRISFAITTNLTLMTEEVADFLVYHSFAVLVSLDGGEEANDAKRKTVSGDGTYEIVARNLELLKRKQAAAGRRLPKIRATLSRGNANIFQVEQDLLKLTPLVMVGEATGTAYGASESDLTEEEISQMQHDLAQAVAAFLAGEEGGLRDSPSFWSRMRAIHRTITKESIPENATQELCGVCRNMKAITPNGDIYPCHRYVGMDAYRMGNVHTGGVDQARVSNYYQQIEDTYQMKCASCWSRYLCGGQCPWYLSKESGELVLPDEPTCQSMREGFELYLGLYAKLLENDPERFKRYIGQLPEDELACSNV